MLLVPQDPRTFLHTLNDLKIVSDPATSGSYWHHGLERSLKSIFYHLKEPISIQININIDRLPLYNSSKIKFWPILFNIFEMPDIPPGGIGIYCGKSKSSCLNVYLNEFDNEMQRVLKHGVYINTF